MEALTELVVQTPRFAGTLCLASGWIHVGTTLRRGRRELRRKHNQFDKNIRQRPLRKDWKRIPGRRSNKDRQRVTGWLDGPACMCGGPVRLATTTGGGEGLTGGQ